MKRIAGLIIASILIVIFSAQLQQVFAKQPKSVSPITSPITSPNCKPGWGIGDKNHCHFGPPGQIKDKSGGKSTHHH